ncbi:hypothetical protein AO240_06740 [Pseudomonas sp. ICMP 460]|nr:hypothetical protein AO240_06740 [Pseudomonas sp. ICMP 460]
MAIYFFFRYEYGLKNEMAGKGISFTFRKRDQADFGQVGRDSLVRPHLGMILNRVAIDFTTMD